MKYISSNSSVTRGGYLYLFYVLCFIVSVGSMIIDNYDECHRYKDCTSCTVNPNCIYCVDEGDFGPKGTCIDKDIYFCPTAYASATTPEECECIGQYSCTDCISLNQCGWCMYTNICDGRTNSTCHLSDSCSN